MFRLSISFLVVAILAAIFGFGGIAETATEAAKIVFYIAVVLVILSAIFGGFKRV